MSLSEIQNRIAAMGRPNTTSPVTLLAVLLCIWGARLFRKHAGEIVDEL